MNISLWTPQVDIILHCSYASPVRKIIRVCLVLSPVLWWIPTMQVCFVAGSSTNSSVPRFLARPDTKILNTDYVIVASLPKICTNV